MNANVSPLTIPAARPATGTAVCNACVGLIDSEWETLVHVGEFSFHAKCAPVCTICGGSLDHDSRGIARDFYVLESSVQFVQARGYHVRLSVCCCEDCYHQAVHDDPPALA